MQDLTHANSRDAVLGGCNVQIINQTVAASMQPLAEAEQAVPGSEELQDAAPQSSDREGLNGSPMDAAVLSALPATDTTTHKACPEQASPTQSAGAEVDGSGSGAAMPGLVHVDLPESEAAPTSKDALANGTQASNAESDPALVLPITDDLAMTEDAVGEPAGRQSLQSSFHAGTLFHNYFMFPQLHAYRGLLFYLAGLDRHGYWHRTSAE